MRRPLFYFITTSICALLNGMLFWVIPNQSTQLFHPAILSLLGISLNLLYIRFLKGFKWTESTDMHRLSLIAGSISVIIMLAFLQELDKTRLDNTSGMALVGLIAITLLLILGLKIKNRNKTSQGKLDRV